MGKDGKKMGCDLKGKNLGKGICQRKDGIYQARIYKSGYDKPVYLYSRKLNVLKQQRDDIIRKQGFGLELTQINQTVNHWFEQWMSLYIVGKTKPTTVRNYIESYDRCKGYIGNLKLRDVNANHIQAVINELEKQGYAETTIHSTIAIISLMFNRAIASKLIFFNPCDGVISSSVKDFTPCDREDEEERKCLTDDEIDRFFDVCKNTRYQELFLILLHTGMRIGEACSLEWKDVDFEKGFIHVRKTINRTKVYYDKNGNKLKNPKEQILITTPKKKASYRDIPMNEEVIVAFHSWKKKQDADRKRLGKKWGKSNKLLDQYPGLIFTTGPGNCYLPTYASQECSRITSIVNDRERKAAEREKRPARDINVHPHLFRHTFITRCYKSGMDPASIMLIVGHAHMDMLEHYNHPDTEFLTKEFEKYSAEILEADDTITKQKI